MTMGNPGHECLKNRKAIISKFVADLRKGDYQSSSILDKWFGKGLYSESIPPNAGYCVGFWVVEKMLVNSKVQELVKWSPFKKEKHIIAVLNELN